jgi:hypothetical protein
MFSPTVAAAQNEAGLCGPFLGTCHLAQWLQVRQMFAAAEADLLPPHTVWQAAFPAALVTGSGALGSASQAGIMWCPLCAAAL